MKFLPVKLLPLALVGALLATPAARGLFQQAILESGAAQAIRDTATANAVTGQLLQALGSPPARRLLTLPADSLVRAQRTFTAGAGGIQVFGPVLDGRTIPLPPLDYLRRQPPPVRVLLGTNLEEARLFSGPGSILEKPNAAALDQVFGTRNGPLVWQAYQRRRQTIAERRRAEREAAAMAAEVRAGLDRAGIKAGNKGAEAVLAMIETVNLLRQIG